MRIKAMLERDVSSSALDEDFRAGPCVELTLDELLSDPMTLAAMAADGIEASAFARASPRAGARLATPRAAARPVVSSRPAAPRGGGDRGFGSSEMRAPRAVIAAKAVKTACGSSCPW
jgi:hypothetical protein